MTKNKQKVILKGTPASSGKVIGEVKILTSLKDVKKMQKGDVLVAPETNPEYTLAIIMASAIVTERGGILSHPAIVAREMGIPGVVGVKDVTQKLKDGMRVVVDGNKGIIYEQ